MSGTKHATRGLLVAIDGLLGNLDAHVANTIENANNRVKSMI
jgi:hypothetical protein